MNAAYHWMIQPLSVHTASSDTWGPIPCQPPWPHTSHLLPFSSYHESLHGDISLPSNCAVISSSVSLQAAWCRYHTDQ